MKTLVDLGALARRCWTGRVAIGLAAASPVALAAACDGGPTLATTDAEIVAEVRGIPDDPGVTVTVYVRDRTPPNNRQATAVPVGGSVSFTNLGAGFVIDVGVEGLDAYRCRVASIQTGRATVLEGQMVPVETRPGVADSVRFDLRCLTATLDVVVRGLPESDSVLVYVPRIDPTAPGSSGAGPDSIWVRNGTRALTLLPRDTASVTPRDVIGADGRRYEAAGQRVALPSRQTTSVVLDFDPNAPNRGTSLINLAVTGLPLDTGIVFAAVARSRVPPFTRDSAGVRLGRGHRFADLAGGIDYDVSLGGLEAYACDVSSASLPYATAGGTVTATVTTGADAGALRFVTFQLLCRSGTMDLVVSGLPAPDSARVSIVSPLDSQSVWARNGTTRVATLPYLTRVQPHPVSGSDDLAYRAPPQSVDVQSRQAVTVTVPYASTPGAACLADAPLARYRLDGGAADASGNGNDGTVQGATTAPDRGGAAGAALSFDGVDDRVDLGDRFDMLGLPFTVTAWVYQPGAAQESFRSILATDDEPGRYAGIWLQTDPAGRLSITYADGGPVGGGSRRTLDSSFPIPTDVWVHVAATVRGPTDMTLYMNGAAVEGIYSGTGGPLAHGPGPARLGAFGLVEANRPWLGQLDDVRVYDCSLDASGVAGVFAEG